ncbi:hypothetical protein LNV23_08345 [Paucibacter sp. DJ1R-11]|uniref:hypothetical protein n=1 Tax=Paucibacter sp. DJ1R-11 TaxID=2893556 RepID=UPI0021E3803A|nr:hypothetical protein [Paucibacter sp. DJ1R-11]MCV2363454.1 hypothetical protein [Paucibacter sp. DJ1R-11]
MTTPTLPTTPTTAELLKYVDLQMAAEAFLVNASGSVRSDLQEALTEGNKHASVFTAVAYGGADNDILRAGGSLKLATGVAEGSGQDLLYWTETFSLRRLECSFITEDGSAGRLPRSEDSRAPNPPSGVCGTNLGAISLSSLSWLLLYRN